MKKYIFTESQIKTIIDGVIEEQKVPLQPATIANKVARGKMNPSEIPAGSQPSATPKKVKGKTPKSAKGSVAGIAKPGSSLRTVRSATKSGCSGPSCTLREQDEEQLKYAKAIQNFLNTKLRANLKVDGVIGPITTQAIEKYQTMIGVYPTDGVWGENTYNKMPKEDKRIFDDFVKSGSDIIDKVLDLFR